MPADQTAAKFPLGQIVATPGALESIPRREMQEALSHHALLGERSGAPALHASPDSWSRQLALTATANPHIFPN